MSELEPLIESFDVAAGYLDWARFGPLSPSVRAEATADAALLGTGRASGIDLVWTRIDEAREHVARLLAAPVDEVVLQPSTTQGLSHAMFGLEGTVVVPSQDFPSIRVTAHRAAQARGVLAVREIDPPNGIVTTDAVVEALTDDVTAVALSLVDFRTGSLADLPAIRDAIGDRLLVVDAIQAFGVVDVDWNAADVVTGNGYKWLRAGRGTGFARFSSRARERIAPVLSGISGMVGDATSLGVPEPRGDAAAYSVSPSDPLAASRLAAALRDIEEVGIATISDEVRARARDVMHLADRYGIPVLTPRDAHAGIVTLAPAEGDASALAAALANHGVTVTARGGTIRVSTHVGTGADSLQLLGNALADAAALRVVAAVDHGRDEIGGGSAPDLITIDIPPLFGGDPVEGAVVAEVELLDEAAVSGDGAAEVGGVDEEIVLAVVEVEPAAREHDDTSAPSPTDRDDDDDDAAEN